MKALVTHLCLTLCEPLDCSPWAPLSVEFSRQEYWSGQPCPSPGALSDPGIKLGSPTLQADSLLSEPSGKPPYIRYIYIYVCMYIYITCQQLYVYICLSTTGFLYLHSFSVQRAHNRILVNVFEMVKVIYSPDFSVFLHFHK